MSKWECFHDASYFDHSAVRNTDDRSFNAAIHVNTKKEAEFLTDRLNENLDLKPKNKVLKLENKALTETLRHVIGMPSTEIVVNGETVHLLAIPEAYMARLKGFLAEDQAE